MHVVLSLPILYIPRLSSLRSSSFVQSSSYHAHHSCCEVENVLAKVVHYEASEGLSHDQCSNIMINDRNRQQRQPPCLWQFSVCVCVCVCLLFFVSSSLLLFRQPESSRALKPPRGFRLVGCLSPTGGVALWARLVWQSWPHWALCHHWVFDHLWALCHH